MSEIKHESINKIPQSHKCEHEGYEYYRRKFVPFGGAKNTLVNSMLLIVLMLFTLSSCSKVEISAGEMVAVFRYGDTDITKPLSDEDSEIVREMFNGKNLYSDSLSCGFSENIALIIDGNAYCVARDDCGKIYNVEKDKFFNLSDKENSILRNLLCEYGFTFPCV